MSQAVITSGTSWPGVFTDGTAIKNESIGGGGGGGNGGAAGSGGGGGGGGGGAYATLSGIAYNSGTTVTIAIGGGGAAQTAGTDTTWNTSVVIAKAGLAGAVGSGTGAGGAGGAAASCTPSTGAFSGGAGGSTGTAQRGGGGGGGAAGPNGAGKAGANGNSSGSAGQGGGGAGGGSATVGSQSVSGTGGQGGTAQDGTAGGTGNSPGNPGSHGSGGGGGNSTGTVAQSAGLGGNGIEWTSAGAGGGGGGGGGVSSGTNASGAGKNGGQYGGGGGGSGLCQTGGSLGATGVGIQGVIVVTYNPSLWNLVQTPNVGVSGTVAWGSPTTIGSLLVAAVSVGYTVSGTFTFTGWTPIGSILNSTTVGVQGFYIPGASSRSGTETCTFSGTVTGLEVVRIVLMEWAGPNGSNPLDVDVTNTGTSTNTPTTASSGTLGQTNELVLAIYGFEVTTVGTPITFSAPTNGFVVAGQTSGSGSSPNNAVGAYYFLPSATTAVSSSVTSSVGAGNFGAVLVSFKNTGAQAAAVAPLPVIVDVSVNAVW